MIGGRGKHKPERNFKLFKDVLSHLPLEREHNSHCIDSFQSEDADINIVVRE